MHKEFWRHIGDNHGYKSILCTNGDIPNANFFKHNHLLPIIAIDGAANKLVEHDIIPSYVVGDLDSVDLNTLSSTKVVYTPEQDKSDLEKAMEFLSTQNLLPTITVGFSGGYIDHILHNMNILLRSDSVLYSDSTVCYSLRENSTKKFILPMGSKISLIGIPSAKVRTEGLKWNLDSSTPLTFPGVSSAFNRTIEKEISITVNEGVALVVIYLFHIQDMGLTC